MTTTARTARPGRGLQAAAVAGTLIAAGAYAFPEPGSPANVPVYIALVLAFMHRPSLMILDEPTTGLDPLHQQEFYGIVRDARDAGLADNRRREG